MPIQYLTPAEAADLLRTTPAALAVRRCRDSGPPYVKEGNRILYPLDALTAYLDANTIHPTEKDSH